MNYANYEFQSHCIPHLFRTYMVESTHYENEAASLVHCNIIYIYISILPFEFRETDFFLAVCVSFALIFIKLIYFICMFPSVMFIQIRKFVSSYGLFFGAIGLALRNERNKSSLGMYLKFVYKRYIMNLNVFIETSKV